MIITGSADHTYRYVITENHHHNAVSMTLYHDVQILTTEGH